MLMFYLVSTVFSLIARWIVIKAVAARFKREHPELVGIPAHQRSRWEEASDLLMFFVPIVNLFVAFIAIVKKDQVYEIALARVLKRAKEV